MNTDANTDDDQELETQEVQPEVEASEAESSPDSGENHEEKSNDGFQERINKVTRDKWEATRRAEAEEQKRRELEAELEKLRNGSQPTQTASQTVDTALQKPELPDDIYDEDKMKKYHQDMISYTENVSKTQAQRFWESQQEAQKKQASQQEQQSLLQKYADNAQKAGVDLDKLANAEKALNQHKLDPGLAKYLMNDPAGPQVITYLADNPAELQDVLSADPYSATAKIATEIKAKALSKTPKVTKAPDPIPEIGGGGALETDDFEKKYGKPEFI